MIAFHDKSWGHSLIYVPGDLPEINWILEELRCTNLTNLTELVKIVNSFGKSEWTNCKLHMPKIVYFEILTNFIFYTIHEISTHKLFHLIRYHSFLNTLYFLAIMLLFFPVYFFRKITICTVEIIHKLNAIRKSYMNEINKS